MRRKEIRKTDLPALTTAADHHRIFVHSS